MGWGVLGVAAALAMLVQEGPADPDEEAGTAPAAEEQEAGSDPQDGTDDEQPEDETEGAAEALPDLPPSEEIIEESLPTVEEIAFPELEGDFDGDGSPDIARARESDTGVQIALELSSTGDTFTEALGADSLRSVEWRVIGPEELFSICDNPIDCPTSGGEEDTRDVIFVTLDGRDSFILHWDGQALETFFVDY